MTCKGETFCEHHEFTDAFRHCTKHSVNLDAELAVAKKCAECGKRYGTGDIEVFDEDDL